MDLCTTCDIAFEERDCPLCEAKSKIEELENKIIDKDEEIEELKEIK